MKLANYRRTALLLAGSFLAAAAVAQGGDAPAGLNIPAHPQILGKQDPNVRKATAIVNGYVITQTDIDHRVATIIASNNGDITKLPPEELEQLRAAVLRNLVDETLQIQAAQAKEIKVEKKDIDRYFAQYATNFRQTPAQFEAYLKSIGSSADSVRREIQGQLAWQRLQNREITPFVNVSEDEVKAFIEKMNAAKGKTEYKISEIFIPATSENAAQIRAQVAQLAAQIRRTGNFAAYARQFSEASTAGVGGDLGWVQAEQLPEPLAEAARQLPVGQVSEPIAVPGGFSILAVADTRQVLTADPRNAVLSLKQMSIRFPQGTTEAQAAPAVQRLTETARSMGGCGGAESAAQKIGAEVVSNDQVRVRELPAALQDMLLQLGVGQPTAPFGSADERVSVLVLCGRDDPQVADGPSYDQVYAQMEEQRVNLRARRYLRDLRRDAVVDYR